MRVSIIHHDCSFQNNTFCCTEYPDTLFGAQPESYLPASGKHDKTLLMKARFARDRFGNAQAYKYTYTASHVKRMIQLFN